jgi:hypothetical protein
MAIRAEWRWMVLQMTDKHAAAASVRACAYHRASQGADMGVDSDV